MPKLFVVFGATGQQGGSIITQIHSDPVLSKNYTLRAITRDAFKPAARALQAKGIQVVSADASDPSSLPAALKSAHTVFIITVTTYDANLEATEYNQGKAMADAAVAAGAEYTVFSTQMYTSTLSGGEVVANFFEVKGEIETYIRSLAPRVKSAFYAPSPSMQNFYGKNAPQPLGDGTYGIFNFVTHQTETPLVDIAGDTGKFVAAILASPEEFEGKVLTGGETRVYTMDKVAGVLSKVTGKKVVYVQIDEGNFRGFMPDKVMADNTVAMFKWMQDFGYFGGETKRLVEWTAEKARGEGTTFEEFLEKTSLALG